MAKKPEDYININKNKIYNKNILITGSTSGIGREAALSLGRLGANVYIHGRNKEKGDKIVKHLREDIGTKSRFFKSDLSKMGEVNALVEFVTEEIDSLDILINNAGGYFRGNKTATNQIEYTFFVNYLSRFILSVRLMPYLHATDTTSQIIFTSSSSHKNQEIFDLNSVTNKKNNWNSYSRANLANVMLSISLARKLNDDEVIVNTVHPGIIPGSNFLRNIPGPIDKISKISNMIPLPGVCSQVEGGATLINTLSCKYSGSYYNKFERERPDKLAQNTDMQDILWRYSVEKTNIDMPEKFID